MATTNEQSTMESRVEKGLEILRSLVDDPDQSDGAVPSSKRPRIQQSDLKGFQKRLESFQSPLAYFAKPLEISPIICARFGWQVVEPNYLRCSHEGCNGNIYIHFDPKLSLNSRSKLTQHYRFKLAEAHCTSCPFYWDAMCWLKPAPSSKSKQDTALESISFPTILPLKSQPETNYCPLFLTNLSDEFGILDDESKHGSIAREYILKQALNLTNDMEVREQKQGHETQEGISDTAHFRWQVELSSKQKEALGKILNINNRLDSDATPSAVRDATNYIDQLMECIVWKNPKALINLNKKAREAIEYMPSREACLLSIFGWRSQTKTLSCEVSHSKDKSISIQCPLCLAVRQVHYVDNVEGFDLAKSHRYYCPYANGFVTGGSETNMDPCWIRVASLVCKRT